MVEMGISLLLGTMLTFLFCLCACRPGRGPFAVAQLRILAEVVELTGSIPKTAPRMYVTTTLSDPEEESGWIPAMLAPIANQRKDANKIMRDESLVSVMRGRAELLLGRCGVSPQRGWQKSSAGVFGRRSSAGKGEASPRQTSSALNG